MRMLSLVALLLLSSLLPAQTASGDELKQTLPPDQTWKPKNYSDSVVATEQQGRVFPGYPARCFFIRSYNFERRGTEMPKLKNMTTCTPAKSDQFRQTDKKPKVRLIPAN